MSSPRKAALNALMAYRKSGTSAEAALDKQIKNLNLEPRDAALAAKLTFGVLQNRTLLDFYLAQFLNTPIEKLEPRVLDILRTAAYQIVFLDRIPARAAVDEAVRMTKAGSPKAAGLVNAVLRRLAEADKLPEPPSLAVKYSHPMWLVKRFVDLLGQDGAEALLAANNAEVPLYAQMNTLKTDALTLEGAEPHPWLPDCLILQGVGNPANLQAFRDGLLYIQDPAAKLAVMAADPKPGTRLLDPCAAPGGKSFAAAIQMGNKGEILASDLQEKKLSKIEEGAERLGLTIIKTSAQDAREFDPAVLGTFDTVIVDAPCSGLGIIRKKPEIRDKTPEEIVRLPEIQLAILQSAARCVAPGGTLLYATCTVLPEENSGVVSAFLADNQAFALEAFTLPDPIGTVPEGQIMLYPHIHDTDGFFFCKLRRVK
ncbi:MAG: 16S rRNA (cytosine(967)-C(5))-methyltransferase RsmB [Oscillospiraceae bacterium]|nr:16S rRNA (cytosine(967)-C(5))-methyltransferase RsmB [Oscillospiraceae bacterium]